MSGYFVKEKYRIFLLRSGQGMRILRIRRIERIWRKVGREHEFGEFYEFYEFFLSLVVVCEFWANLAEGGKGMRIWRIERILRIFLSLVMVCEFWANGNE